MLLYEPDPKYPDYPIECGLDLFFFPTSWVYPRIVIIYLTYINNILTSHLNDHNGDHFLLQKRVCLYDE